MTFGKKKRQQPEVSNEPATGVTNKKKGSLVRNILQLDVISIQHYTIVALILLSHIHLSTYQ